jgi:hypothetical protein
MTIRREVQDFIDAGPFPDSEVVSVEEVARLQELLEAIKEPVSDAEGLALVQSFGPDTFFGLAWSLMHLIETAPGALTALYPDSAGLGGDWTSRLNARVANARELRALDQPQPDAS